MLIRKLLLSGLLLVLAQSLRGVTLANDMQRSAEGFLFSSAAIEPAKASKAGDPAAVASPSPQIHAFRHRLLSPLILPLPPLILPELLLPPYSFPSFNSQRLDQELQLYSQYLRTFGTPDVLIVGSSRSLQGIDPAALQETLAARGYPGLRVFNFGINGGTAQVNDLLLRRILTPEHLPRLILWGDGSRAFNEGRLDITYNGILASEGYKRLISGDRPIPSRWVVWDSAATAPKSLVAAERQAAGPIAPGLQPNGFEPIQGRFDPLTYYQQYPRVPGAFDADYQNFRLAGAQTAAAIATARFARSQGIKLVFVNLPLTEDYLDATRRAYEQQFRQHMQQLASQEQFVFRDLSQQPELLKNEYFADPSHINHDGARAIATHLAADATLPWQILGSTAIAPDSSR